MWEPKRAGLDNGGANFRGKGAEIGEEISGNILLPKIGQTVIWDESLFYKHALVVGSPGTGKTETLMKLLYEVAQLEDEGMKIKIIVVDAKADYDSARRFVGLMKLAKREAAVIPRQHLDGFRGDGRAIAERLNSVIPHAEAGPATWWRDIGENVIRAVCNAEAGPPRSSKEVLERLDIDALDARGAEMARQMGFSAAQFHDARVRYNSLWGDLGNRFDGVLGLEDLDTAYVTCSSLGSPLLTGKFSAYFVADLLHFLTQRKGENEGVLILFDEFPALAKYVSLEEPLEQLRGSKSGFILAAQTMSGIGDQLTQARYVGAADLLIAHGGRDAEMLAKAAGMKKVVGITRRYGEGQKAEIMARPEEKARIQGSDIGKLGTGEAFLIRQGTAGCVDVKQAPETKAELPPEEELRDPVVELAEPPEAAPMDAFMKPEVQGEADEDVAVEAEQAISDNDELDEDSSTDEQDDAGPSGPPSTAAGWLDELGRKSEGE